MRDIYQNPLIMRYAGKEMAYCFSDYEKIRTWRRLWVALAEAEMELGLPITPEQVAQLKAHCDDINFDEAEAREREVRHDVMAHIYAYGLQCPLARPIIHLGATSCYVGDNADLIAMRNALGILRAKLVNVLALLSDFALRYRSLPTLGFTHFQPAQLTTVGKRASLWLQEFWMDYEKLEYVAGRIRMRGLKGTTGTQASFLALFDGDEEKVKRLERSVMEKMGFDSVFPVTGQTYPRKLDFEIVSLLSSISQSASKMANDIRMLQHMKEIEEPFEKQQIGSSAMAYKRNPMRTERICALARFVMSLESSPAMTASTQWFERTLDDSANRRLTIPQSFLATDGILNLVLNVVNGLVVYEPIIRRHIAEELPFMATEYLLMEAVKRGGDRQQLHERIRVHSMEAARRVKEMGEPNDLIDRIRKDNEFPFTGEELDALMDPRRFIGRSAGQVSEFVETEIRPILEENSALLGDRGEVRV
ncbi:MAG: adenylosuccinate lyase [Clostridiales bacterium]|nr:adenylosuccinate lyase [Clostridiales bacterium]